MDELSEPLLKTQTQINNRYYLLIRVAEPCTVIYYVFIYLCIAYIIKGLSVESHLSRSNDGNNIIIMSTDGKFKNIKIQFQ